MYFCNVWLSASGKGFCHHMQWSWPGLSVRFGSWKSMLDPCTWGLPHHWGWPNLGQRVSLGHLDFRARKEEANSWTCLNTLSFLVRSWKKVFFAMFDFWTWDFAVHRCCVSASGKGVCHHIWWSWPGLFFRFGSWKSMLDPCTWGLPHLSLITGGGRTWGAG